MTSVSIIKDVPLKIFKLSTPLSDMLHFHTATTTHFCQVAVDFDGQNMFRL
jgi:hypothetical protein